MDRLISADKLKAHYSWWEGGTGEITYAEAKALFDTIVDLQPTVTPETNEAKEEKKDEFITPQMFADQMSDFPKEGVEMGHSYADNLMVKVLRQFGYTEGADIFDVMPKWYS